MYLYIEPETEDTDTIMRLHAVNETQFIKPTTPLTVYILGLLWADGYIKHPYTITLATTYPDADYLIPLFLKTGKWKHYKKIYKNKRWKVGCTIKTSNKPLFDFLESHDYSSKSNESADKILSIIPNHLKHCWFRGLLDGDGHIHTDNSGCHNVSFSSTINQNWSFLELLCKKLEIEYSIRHEKRNTGNSSRFYVYGKHKTIKFCEFMYGGYSNDFIGLKRKHDKFLQLKETEKRNRYVGVCQSNTGKWRAYTSAAKGNKPKSLGEFHSKEEALKTVENFYSIQPKLFMS